MKPYYQDSACTIFLGDCVTVLREMEANSVHCCVTSPPYWGLRDYGCSGQIGLEKTPEQYVAKMVEVFREVRRVLRDDATIWLNLGDSYAANQSSGDKVFGNTEFNKNRPSRVQTKTPERRLNGLKPKDLVGIPWRVAFALQADGWYLRSDIIWAKCLSGGAIVYAQTQKGEMPMTVKDMVRLDPKTVKLWNGQKWTKAVSWQRTPRVGNEIELVFRNGARIGCTPEHRWPTTRGTLQAKDLAIGDMVPTCTLPEPGQPRRPDCVPDDIEWFLGIYIAEGSQSDGTIQIASHIDQTNRFARLRKIADRFDGHCFMVGTGGKAATININSPILLGVLNAYVSGITAKDKHLSVRCWQRSNAFLRAVLDGYLEGDGHNAVDRWRLGFCANDNLAADLRTLCSRLGLSLRLKRTFHTCTNSPSGPKRFPGWRGEIRDSHRDSGGEIVDIVPSRARVFWDIAVEDEPHLFSLACGILTHNSNPMPESVTDRPTKAHEYIFLLSKDERYFFDAEAIKETGGDPKPCGPKNDAMRNDSNRVQIVRGDGATRNKRTVWTVSTYSYAGAHFATYPPDLIKPCILAGTSARGCCPKCGAPWERIVEDSPEYAAFKKAETERRNGSGIRSSKPETLGLTRGTSNKSVSASSKTLGWQPTCECGETTTIPCTVLDPFGGSGTTAQVAIEHGRKAILIELNPEYVQLAQRRTNVTPGLTLA